MDTLSMEPKSDPRFGLQVWIVIKFISNTRSVGICQFLLHQWVVEDKATNSKRKQRMEQQK